MICPFCQLELGVERQAGEVVLTYSLNDRAQRCRHQRGDPVLCQSNADRSGPADGKATPREPRRVSYRTRPIHHLPPILRATCAERPAGGRVQRRRGCGTLPDT
jgi:hypothetical protein